MGKHSYQSRYNCEPSISQMIDFGAYRRAARALNRVLTWAEFIEQLRFIIHNCERLQLYVFIHAHLTIGITEPRVTGPNVPATELEQTKVEKLIKLAITVSSRIWLVRYAEARLLNRPLYVHHRMHNGRIQVRKAP